MRGESSSAHAPTEHVSISGGGTVGAWDAERIPSWQKDIPKFQEPERIVKTPGILGGKPRIAGRRIAVQHIAVWHYQMGMSANEIMRELSLTPYDLTKALEYYQTHREEINRSIEEDEKLATEMQQRFPSKLQAKLRAQRSG